jgi:hypothetical protein
MAAVVNGVTTKDGVLHTSYICKEPLTQWHWTDLSGELSCPQLDIRKSGGEYAVSVNPLPSSVEIFNYYDRFWPQNLMLEYVASSPGSCPIKKFPYPASAPEWSYHATHKQEIEPTNLTLWNILQRPDPDMDEWGSDKDCQWKARVASWRTSAQIHPFGFNKLWVDV